MIIYDQLLIEPYNLRPRGEIINNSLYFHVRYHPTRLKRSDLMKKFTFYFLIICFITLVSLCAGILTAYLTYGYFHENVKNKSFVKKVYIQEIINATEINDAQMQDYSPFQEINYRKYSLIDSPEKCKKYFTVEMLAPSARIIGLKIKTAILVDKKMLDFQIVRDIVLPEDSTKKGGYAWVGSYQTNSSEGILLLQYRYEAYLLLRLAHLFLAVFVFLITELLLLKLMNIYFNRLQSKTISEGETK